MMIVLANAFPRGRAARLTATGDMMLRQTRLLALRRLGVGLMAKLIPVLFTLLIVAGGRYRAWIGVTLMRSVRV